jgi:hypothetical protein
VAVLAVFAVARPFGLLGPAVISVSILTAVPAILRPSQMIQATTSTCSPNDARQLIGLVTTPPISGPAATPSPPAPRGRRPVAP